MNSAVVALAFNSTHHLSAVGKPDASLAAAAICTAMETKSSLRIYRSADDCRAQLREQPSSYAVIVVNRQGRITPINLAAALCTDDPERDVYLMDDVPTENLAVNAKLAGVRGLIDAAQTERLLAPWLDRASLPSLLAVSGAGDAATLEGRDLPAHEDGEVCAAHQTPAPRATEVYAGHEAPAPRPAERAPLEVEALNASLALASVPMLPRRELPSLLQKDKAAVGEGPSVAAEQYLAPSLEIAAPLKIKGMQEYDRQTHGRILGFFSGRGGVGKSTVSLITALQAQRQGLKTALVDLDLQFGDLGFLAGSEAAASLQRMALSELCESGVLPELIEGALTLVCAPERPEQGDRYSASIVSLMQALAASHDIVVVNSGSFWTDIHASVISCCTQVALLMDQRSTSVEACKQAIDLCLRLQVPEASFLLLLNGCGRSAALTPQDVSLALGGFEVFGIADGGLLVDELLALGCPMELLSSNNAFVSSIKKLLDKVLGRSQIAADNEVAAGEQRSKAGIFDLGGIRRIFEGGRRVPA